METIEKKALKVKELLNRLGYNDIVIEEHTDKSCEWRPNKKISIKSEVETFPRSSLEVNHEKFYWQFSFNGSFFQTSDNLFQLFLKNIVLYFSKDDQSSQGILAMLEKEAETSNLETVDFFLDAARELFGKFRIEETRMKISADAFVAIYGKATDDEVEYSVILHLDSDNPDTTELKVYLETRVFYCDLRRKLSKNLDKSDLSQAVMDVKKALSAFNDICTQLEDESNYSLRLVESPSAQPTPKWVLGNFREIMAVYGNAVLPFQAGVFPNHPEYLSDEFGKYIEFSSKIKSLNEMLEGFPDGQWHVQILEDCSC